MSGQYSIYCDESGHFDHESQNCMVLGCLIVEQNFVSAANSRIKQIKEKWGVQRFTEIKWTKVSPSKINMYLEILEYFLDSSFMQFRCVLIPDKSVLSHEVYNQTSNDFYYKMFYTALNHMIEADSQYKVFFDYKDKIGMERIQVLKSCLVSKKHISPNNFICDQVQSYESQLIQLADLLIGAVGYKSRGIYTSDAKKELVDVLENRLRIDISHTTLMSFIKFSVLRWSPTMPRCQ